MIVVICSEWVLDSDRAGWMRKRKLLSLEKAINLILAKLEAKPPVKLKRPEYPVRVWEE